MISNRKIHKNDVPIKNILLGLQVNSTCLSRKVACLICGYKGNILSKGYNHHYEGISCKETGTCLRAGSKSGENLDKCKIVHAEIDAIHNCSKLDEARMLFVTASPCENCIKELLKTNIQEIYFLEEYPHSISKELWQQVGRKWEKLA